LLDQGGGAAGRMKAVGRGSIGNISAAVATRPVPWFAAYAASMN
jgi:NAD(P)-dependent dehydrogenase (short-subunit alcohol dehydrogenase family)